MFYLVVGVVVNLRQEIIACKKEAQHDSFAGFVGEEPR